MSGPPPMIGTGRVGQREMICCAGQRPSQLIPHCKADKSVTVNLVTFQHFLDSFVITGGH